MQVKTLLLDYLKVDKAKYITLILVAALGLFDYIKVRNHDLNNKSVVSDERVPLTLTNPKQAKQASEQASKKAKLVHFCTMHICVYKEYTCA